MFVIATIDTAAGRVLKMRSASSQDAYEDLAAFLDKRLGRTVHWQDVRDYLARGERIGRAGTIITRLFKVDATTFWNVEMAGCCPDCGSADYDRTTGCPAEGCCGR